MSKIRKFNHYVIARLVKLNSFLEMLAKNCPKETKW